MARTINEEIQWLGRSGKSERHTRPLTVRLADGTEADAGDQVATRPTPSPGRSPANATTAHALRDRLYREHGIEPPGRHVAIDERRVEPGLVSDERLRARLAHW